MPTLNKNYSLTITPEQFIDACSRNEIIETQFILDSTRIRKKFNPDYREPLVPDAIAYNFKELIFSTEEIEEANRIMIKISQESGLQMSQILPLRKYFVALEKLRLKSLVKSPQIINTEE